MTGGAHNVQKARGATDWATFLGPGVGSALDGIGARIPDTIRDRAITIAMVRRTQVVILERPPVASHGLLDRLVPVARIGTVYAAHIEDGVRVHTRQSDRYVLATIRLDVLATTSTCSSDIAHAGSR